MKAHEFLESGIQAIKDRASFRDVDAERSMGRTVKAFNAIYDTNLTEEQGWMFMVMLKAARSRGGKFNSDDYVDGAAYFGLAGEAAFVERTNTAPNENNNDFIDGMVALMERYIRDNANSSS